MLLACWTNRLLATALHSVVVLRSVGTGTDRGADGLLEIAVSAQEGLQGSVTMRTGLRTGMKIQGRSAIR